MSVLVTSTEHSLCGGASLAGRHLWDRNWRWGLIRIGGLVN